MSRRCPFDGCTEEIHPHLFACPEHWCSMSRPLRDRVYAMYRDYRACKIGVEELRVLQGEVLAEHYGRKEATT